MWNESRIVKDSKSGHRIHFSTMVNMTLQIMERIREYEEKSKKQIIQSEEFNVKENRRYNVSV